MPLRIRGQANSHEELFAEYVRELAKMDLVICVSREVESDLHGYWKEFGCAPTPTVRAAVGRSPSTRRDPETQAQLSPRVISIYVSRLKLRKNHLAAARCLRHALEAAANRSRSISSGSRTRGATRAKILKRMRQLALQRRPGALAAAYQRRRNSPRPTATARSRSSPRCLEGFGLPIIESLWHGRPVVCGQQRRDRRRRGRRRLPHHRPERCRARSRSAISIRSSITRFSTDKLYDEARAPDIPFVGRLWPRPRPRTRADVRNFMMYLDVTGGCTLPAAERNPAHDPRAAPAGTGRGCARSCRSAGSPFATPTRDSVRTLPLC